ncbi:RDD family protein [Mycobacterium cookii]|uniref:RDD family protein n=1 Tax=Nocardioides furvisabuli TaxID=375542 RepID=A0ABN2XGK5_9ACTN|nr:RDD family protein [Nocardioides furvisabuli]
MTSAVTVDPQAATFGRRLLALLIDFATSWAFALALIELDLVPDSGTPGTIIIIAEMALFTAVLGGSFGKLVMHIRVVRHDDPSRPVGLLRALVRTVLTFLILPPLLTYDERGLHDVVAGTRTVVI